MSYHFHRYNTNILTTETATGYQSVTSCRVWKVYVPFFNTHFQSPAPGSKRSEIPRSLLIVLLKTKLMNNCASIAIE